jgi:hypothetical protein
MVVSNMNNRSFMVPLRGQIVKAARSACSGCAAGTAELGVGLCARGAQQQACQKQAAGEKLQHCGVELHAGNISGFPRSRN